MPDYTFILDKILTAIGLIGGGGSSSITSNTSIEYGAGNITAKTQRVAIATDNAPTVLTNIETDADLIAGTTAVDGAAVPTRAILVAGRHDGILKHLAVDNNGHVIVSATGAQITDESIAISPAYAPNSTITPVNSSATSVVLLNANSDRKTAVIVNDSTSTLYIVLDATAASTTNYTFVLEPRQAGKAPSFVTFTGADYSGEVRGIWDSANGAARITETT